MGRGTSAAGKGGGGGKTLPPLNQASVASGNVLPDGGVPFSSFTKMTDAQKAKVITDAIGTATPLFLDDSSLQRFAYFTGMSEKPTVVSDKKLDSMKGQEVFRTVSSVYDPMMDVGYSSHEIIDQISTGDFTMFSDSGGSVHGKAIYFATNVSDSAAYGRGAKSSMMRAKINGKGTTETKLRNEYQRALKRGDPVAKAASKAQSGSQMQIYGLAKGYTHYQDSSYVMVLNRSCLTVSDRKKDNIDWGTSTW